MADDYIITANKTESYLKHYKNVKKKETAYAAASRLFDKPEMKAYIEERMRVLDEERIADQREVLRYLTAVLRGEEKEETLIGVGPGEQEITETEVSTRDRIKAAELIGKRYGLWTEKVDMDVAMPVIVFDVPDDDG